MILEVRKILVVFESMYLIYIALFYLSRYDYAISVILFLLIPTIELNLSIISGNFLFKSIIVAVAL